MDISFEQLKSMVVFAQVVEQGSLSAAAKHIGLSRAVVSYHIKKLETHLSIKLLNRSTRSITLTEAGEQYFQRCRAIAEQASAANQQIENLKNEPEGLIKPTFRSQFRNKMIRTSRQVDAVAAVDNLASLL